ncbi:MAG: hypothetical protein IIX27_02310 [Ruminococcus sp.]|nr:hypothetical protein [Ruminococcus sp.]
MQDMLKKIIEMDEQARLVKEQAQQEKAATEQEIIDTKKRIYNEYIERAKIRVEKNLEVDRTNAQKQWEKSQVKNEEIINELETSFSENSEKWADEIVKRVLA